MKFGLLYEIEVARPWTDTSVADCFLRRGGRDVMPHFNREH
jgi:hypothetical protein